MILTGTIVNSLTIIAGTVVGLLLGKFIPDRFNDAISKGIALCVLYIGVDGMLAGENALISILSIVLGVILGELLRLDDRIRSLGDWVERRFAGKHTKGSISEGFVSASLLFCVGAMAIMGALDSGLLRDHSTLYAKSTLDGITSIVYSSTMGVGVALSAGRHRTGCVFYRALPYACCHRGDEVRRFDPHCRSFAQPAGAD